MPIVNEIHVIVDVEDDRYVGTNDPLNLTISGGGVDLFEGTWTGANLLGSGQTVPQNRTGAALVPRDTEWRRKAGGGPFVSSDFRHRENYLVYTDVEDPYALGVDTAQLDPSSIRLSIRGGDLIYPRHIVVWGVADLPLANYPGAPATLRTPVPLGMALNVNRRLSSTFSEGPQSMLIPRVAPWVRANPPGGERRVDQVILTLGLGPSPNAPAVTRTTAVTFRIVTANGTEVCTQALDGATSLRSSEWKTWLFPVTTPFTWPEIMPTPPPPQPCRLRVDDGDSIRLSHVFAFGIDSTTSPPALLPLVHISNTDGTELLIGGEPMPERLLLTANHDISEVS